MRRWPEADATRLVLGHVLDTLLRLLHPLVPFVTEDAVDEPSPAASRSPWPRGRRPMPPPTDPAAEAEIVALQELVTEVRRFRTDQGLKPGQKRGRAAAD